MPSREPHPYLEHSYDRLPQSVVRSIDFPTVLYDRLLQSVDVDISLVLRTSIAEREHDFYSSSVTLGLRGCSLAPIVLNLERTVNLKPETAL